MKKVFVYRHCPVLLVLAFFCGNAYALQGSTAANGSNAQAVHDLGITGSGIHIGFVAAGNVQTDHFAFQDSSGISHAINHNVTGSSFSYNNHDTALAGIIISRGSLPNHPNDIGVAANAFVHCARAVYDSDIKPILDYLIGDQSCRIIVTGFHWPNFPPNGQSQQTLMYDYYADENDIIFTNAAGNNYPQITVYGDCFNGITTGGLEDPITDNYSRVGDVTNPGPTSDGRKKPDIMTPSTGQVVPGYSGDSNNYWTTTGSDGATSWAIPHTAGVAALLLQYANQVADDNAGHNEVIKAVIVNSAFPNIEDESGNSTNPADSNHVWHSQRGYGRIDALKAYQTLSSGRITRNSLITASAGWAYGKMTGLTTDYYYIEGHKNERLVLTITWNRKVDKSSTRYEANLPMFNIDMTIENPAKSIMFSEIDDVNNLEKIDLVLPNDGNYTVLLKNMTSKSRDYGLAFEIIKPLEEDFNYDYIVDNLDLKAITEDWLEEGIYTEITGNNIVNWPDFAEFADNWLKIESRYYEP